MSIGWRNLDAPSMAISHEELESIAKDNYECPPDLFTRRSHDAPAILVVVQAWTRILNHIDMSLTEQGGLLIGYAAVSAERSRPTTLLIARSIPAVALSSSSVSLSIAPETWATAQREAASLNAGRYAHVIGWYHSHPNLGAFFSGTDRHTQRSFFRQDYSLGIVIDPCRRECRAFIGPDSHEVPLRPTYNKQLPPTWPTPKRKRPLRTIDTVGT
jgi:proteasome lid subunit RPN8/RPN11